MSSGYGTGTQTGAGDPTTRQPIKRIGWDDSDAKITTKPSPNLKRSVEMDDEDFVEFEFNPTAPEEWRSTAPIVIQLYASQLMSKEEGRERLGLGAVKENETFAPMPTQGLTPGQANKITTNPRATGGIQNPKGMVSKPPEQQEPREVSSGTSGLSMPQLVSGEPAVQGLGTPDEITKKKPKERRQTIKILDDETIEVRESLS